MLITVKQVKPSNSRSECEVTLTVDAIPSGADITPEAVARWMGDGEVPGSLYVLVDVDGEALDVLSDREKAERSRGEWRAEGTRAKLYAVPREWVLNALGDGGGKQRRAAV